MTGVVSADVAAPSFWIFVVSAVVALNLAAGAGGYRRVLAATNLAFCALVLGTGAALATALGLVLMHGLTRPAPWRAVTAALAAVLLGAAFVLHKQSGGGDSALQAAKALLTGLGFSYVALRGVELVRASVQGETVGQGLADTVNYLIPFHMLLAGPIVAFSDFRKAAQPAVAPGADGTLEALERIARGLFKKFVLANGLLATVFLTDFRAEGWYFLFEVQVYYLFIYLDFSAYTDIAVGIGRLLGVNTPENFRRPLSARNIIEFWDRWHISLSQFIRRNIFIPMQLTLLRRSGGRHPLRAASVAFLCAFVLCGLWHGLSARFALWGLAHALAVVACNLYRHALTRRLGREGLARYQAHPGARALATLLTFEFVAFSLTFIAHPATAFLD